jgi:hypothetical protein
LFAIVFVCLFQIVEMLVFVHQKGTFGKVVLAEDREERIEVAIKVVCICAKCR